MKMNFDYYKGEDLYCDGETEKEILQYEEKYNESEFSEIFKTDIRWPIFYHLTPIRKNIINWYLFKENSEVLEIGAGMGAITSTLCEKATKVTAVELSKQRATSIANRCKDKENLEIIVGNFNDIKFEKKYDYITLIGVFEYAQLYTNTNNPFHDFLVKVKSLLKEDGKLLIAIENQFGMKYFSGAKEDHTAKIYDGITGYTDKKGIRTFGEYEIKQILKNADLPYTKFYYPMPDYKLPNIIFSDDYLPTEETIQNYTPYVSEENFSVNFDEKKAFLDVIKNNKFGFFANSFFIEASAMQIETEVELAKQKLIQIDENIKKFYDKHYKIDEANKKLQQENKEDSKERELLEENEKLKNELNAMANSKSWKMTKIFRDLRTQK